MRIPFTLFAAVALIPATAAAAPAVELSTGLDYREGE